MAGQAIWGEFVGVTVECRPVLPRRRSGTGRSASDFGAKKRVKHRICRCL